MANHNETILSSWCDDDSGLDPALATGRSWNHSLTAIPGLGVKGIEVQCEDSVNLACVRCIAAEAARFSKKFRARYMQCVDHPQQLLALQTTEVNA